LDLNLVDLEPGPGNDGMPLHHPLPALFVVDLPTQANFCILL
jgi:hypothetical protein